MTLIELCIPVELETTAIIKFVMYVKINIAYEHSYEDFMEIWNNCNNGQRKHITVYLCDKLFFEKISPNILWDKEFKVKEIFLK
jgi:hypothetical protein